MGSTTVTKTQTCKIGYSGDFTFHVCGNCGVEWGMTTDYLDERQFDGKTWFCPNGHKWYFSGAKTEREKIERELQQTKDRLATTRAAADQERAAHEHTSASLRSTKGVVTKLRKRVSAGVCPCCNRSFKDLARHMAGQHPDWGG